ncbi:MAG TPA: Panacea domain-containing protein [Candidatus Xenobia bacterium]|jgi:hypothetical protein
MPNAKFKELILHVAKRSETDPRFGMVKLNKILFSADFEQYYRHQRSITDAEYQHQPQGPTARAMVPVVEELKSLGEAAVDLVDHHGKKQKRLIAKREPNLDLVPADELALVNWFIDTYWQMNASEISEFSHQRFAGWRATSDGETIPYGTIFVDEQPPDEDLAKFGITPESLAAGEKAIQEGHYQDRETP